MQLKESWEHTDRSSRERFAIRWDELNARYGIYHAFEDHELEQIGIVGLDGLTVWDHYANFPLPWAVIRALRDPDEYAGAHIALQVVNECIEHAEAERTVEPGVDKVIERLREIRMKLRERYKRGE